MTSPRAILTSNGTRIVIDDISHWCIKRYTSGSNSEYTYVVLKSAGTYTRDFAISGTETAEQLDEIFGLTNKEEKSPYG